MGLRAFVNYLLGKQNPKSVEPKKKNRISSGGINYPSQQYPDDFFIPSSKPFYDPNYTPPPVDDTPQN